MFEKSKSGFMLEVSVGSENDNLQEVQSDITTAIEMLKASNPNLEVDYTIIEAYNL